MVEHASGPGAAPLTVSEAWRRYVAVTAVDPKTLSVYESCFTAHVEPALGHRPVASLTPDDVRAVLDGLVRRGASASLVRLTRIALVVTCRRAAQLGALSVLPTDGVRVARPESPATRVLEPDEFWRLHEALPTEGARLLAELLVRSGLRIGEALALCHDDLEGEALLVRRCLSEPGRRFAADGRRFVLRPSTKNGAPRRVVVGADLLDRVRSWAAADGAADEEVLFPARRVLPPPTGRSFPRRVHDEPLTPERLERLGSFTGPNGQSYQHGTMNGYVTGRCREACCRQAISEYSAAKKRERAERRRGDGASGRPGEGVARRPPVLPRLPSGEAGAAAASAPPLGALSPQGWARVWSDAASGAGLDFRPLARQTRHAHASWLNSGGVSVDAIAVRLGHRDERSTRGYVRPVGREREPVAVLDALLARPEVPVGECGPTDL